MHLQKHLICGIHITERVTHAVQVQEILTRYGGYIKTRLGLHDVDDDFNSPNGLLLVEFLDDENKFAEFIKSLEGIEGVEVKQMIFEHP